jgi:hypothetical protein
VVGMVRKGICNDIVKVMDATFGKRTWHSGFRENASVWGR